MDRAEREKLKLIIGERRARAAGLGAPLANTREALAQAQKMPDGIGNAEQVARLEADIAGMEREIAGCLAEAARVEASLE